jgi:hypothetical protein
METIRNRRNIGELRLLTKREITDMITIPTLAKSIRFTISWHVVATHVQLKLATLERAWPPRMLFRMLNITPAVIERKLGIIAP